MLAAHYVAVELNRTIDELSDMSMSEFYEWVAFISIRNERENPTKPAHKPWERQYLEMQIASAVHNARLKKKTDA